MNADLLGPGSCQPLLAWLPDETLFSLCSRLHRLSGRALSSETTLAFFGHRSSGSQHDFPSRIGVFCQRTGNAYGDAGQVIRERTALAFYAPFLNAPAMEAAALAMSGPSVAHLKFRLGLLTSRFRANHPLKACAQCMSADLNMHGWVHWHREHQFPGVWVCPIHQSPLSISAVKSTGVGRFLWHLPTEAQISAAWAIDCDLAELVRLGQLTVALARLPRPNGWLEPSLVRKTIRDRMALKGWVTSEGALRLGPAAADFLRFSRSLRVVHELSALPCTVDEAKSQIPLVVRQQAGGTHPLRLLVAINWLFDDVGDFVAAHDRCAEPLLVGTGSTAEGSLPTGNVPDSGEAVLVRRAELLRQLGGGKAVSAVANDLGIDVATAIAWATQAGVHTGRRPKVLKPEIRSELVAKLRSGADKEEVARWAGISVETVTRLLRSEVGLHAEWQAARYSAAQSRARSAWMSVWNDHRGAGAKLMRAMAPAAFAWLYRHDREWLHQHTPLPAINLATAGKSSVRWDERDARLSQTVQEAILELWQRQTHGRLRLWQIYQVVPDLKAKLSRLDRLPLTRRALEEALSWRPGSDASPSLLD